MYCVDYGVFFVETLCNQAKLNVSVDYASSYNLWCILASNHTSIHSFLVKIFYMSVEAAEKYQN